MPRVYTALNARTHYALGGKMVTTSTNAFAYPPLNR
jgi:hypothetical protein